MDKSDKIRESRCDAILKLVSEEKIDCQEIILDRLKKMGYNATQSTVSRDIKKLGIIKTFDSDGVLRYMPSRFKFIDNGIFAAAVKSADCAGHTVVIKCGAGTAQAVCTALDATDYPDIVGTIAGDDTIFVLMKSEKDAQNLVRNFRKELLSDDD